MVWKCEVRTASRVPATTRSSLLAESDCWAVVGLMTGWPSIQPTRTPATAFSKGMSARSNSIRSGSDRQSQAVVPIDGSQHRSIETLWFKGSHNKPCAQPAARPEECTTGQTKRVPPAHAMPGPRAHKHPTPIYTNTHARCHQVLCNRHAPCQSRSITCQREHLTPAPILEAATDHFTPPHLTFCAPDPISAAISPHIRIHLHSYP